MDRGDDIVKIFDLIKSLKKQAPKKNSIVHLILGNHEIYNLRANYFFTSTNDLKSFGSLENREKALSLKGKYGKLIREEMKPVLTIDDSIFVHAGLYSEFIENGVEHLNEYVHQILKTAPSIDEICELKKKRIDHPLYSNPILVSEKSPFDNRDFSTLPEKEICPEVEKILKMTNTKRMIIGHTVQQYDEMQSRCNNQLLIIDIGMSYCYGDYFGYVEILNDKNEVWFRYNNN
ncbi:hypothetical protein LY90DRAFT_520039 [Neocallimastix californiae]|uniref:Metallo-dependent phosphatase n=1 Tax=Neocallimastix californiae TaxID=1754190 RepID=A0A1Y1YJI4_9FUNG|nr:hypothetical protein LY90DRAFT_520039 [Neocallimastix californiae]|eukprot:ORX97764.1 hypothetical protein LY90DRAFT_520039 [Neocallimastix californiae]